MQILEITILAVALLLAGAAFADTPMPEFAPILRIPFDGSAVPAIGGETVTITGADGLTYVEGKQGQAADFLEGGCVEYHGLPGFNMQSGTLEIWLNPDHPRQEIEDHFYLQFMSEDKSAYIELKFYHVELAPQVIMRDQKQYRRYGWSFNEKQWNHIVVTWDTLDTDNAGLHLYHDGGQTGYPAPYGEIRPPTFLRVGCKSPEEGLHAKALIDEICVYSRQLTPDQVKLLHQSGGLPFEQKLAAMNERIAADDAVIAQRMDQLFNRSRLGIIHGRYTSLVNWPDARFTELGLPVPEPINENDLEKTDLSLYAMLLVPGGGGLRLTDPNKEALHAYVRAGGGYVGICGGATTAITYGLIDAEMYPFDVRGPVFNTLFEHPVTEGYDVTKKLLVPHASGPLMTFEEPTQTSVMTFRVGKPPLPPFTSTIARNFGAGRVLIFSGHPEGAVETRRLLRNAVMWAAKIIAPEDAPAEQP